MDDSGAILRGNWIGECPVYGDVKPDAAPLAAYAFNAPWQLIAASARMRARIRQVRCTFGYGRQHENENAKRVMFEVNKPMINGGIIRCYSSLSGDW